jgi:hypothetical protein
MSRGLIHSEIQAGGVVRIVYRMLFEDVIRNDGDDRQGNNIDQNNQNVKSFFLIQFFPE